MPRISTRSPFANASDIALKKMFTTDSASVYPVHIWRLKRFCNRMTEYHMLYLGHLANDYEVIAGIKRFTNRDVCPAYLTNQLQTIPVTKSYG